MIVKAIGTMSGTSMDGIDIALIETDGNSHIEEIANHSVDYTPWFQLLLKATEYAARCNNGDLAAAAQQFDHCLAQFLHQDLSLSLSIVQAKRQELAMQFFEATSRAMTLDNIIFYSTELHKQAIQTLINKTQILPDVIGYHGQTLFHNPAAKLTVQMGDPEYLAKTLGVPIAYDFRSKDILAGGQGAPLAPIYHQALSIRDQLIPCGIINCGGISNITVVDTPIPEDLLSFDVGPGNCLIDSFIRKRTQGKKQMDSNGELGSKGTVNPEILSLLQKTALLDKKGNNFLLITPPKSLDVADCQLIPELMTLTLEDACATLEAFTATCIAESLKLISVKLKKIILAGGGCYNPIICQQLREQLPDNITLLTTENIGWNNKALEAQLFAYLAVRHLYNKPFSFPKTTGVKKPLSGGKIIKAKTFLS